VRQVGRALLRVELLAERADVLLEGLVVELADPRVLGCEDGGVVAPMSCLKNILVIYSLGRGTGDGQQ